jgi:Secretion system C-terminal sorting domain/Concanavalin A-like lectin/glucanases superfamily
MKQIFTKTVLFFIILTGLTFAQIPSDLNMIAHYKLDGTPDDATGNNPPIQLINTPYQDGGIYLNGIYTGNDPVNGSDATTPQINGFTFSKFAIEAKFKITSYQTNPVFVGGTGWRWMGFYIFDSTAALFYNNGNFVSSTVTISLNTFHTATVVYDSSSQMGKWYMDGSLIDSVSFVLQHGDDKNVSTSNFGMGFVFEGIFDNLKIYSLSGVTGVEDVSGSVPSSFELTQNYPNPFNPSTVIRYAIGSKQFTTLRVYDVIGNEVATLVNEEKPAGYYEVNFDAGYLPSGIYFYKLQAGNFIQTKKMLLLK